MERLQAEALELLEFPKVRLHLAAHTSFTPAREEALALEPSFELEEVVRRQRETQDGVRLLEAAGELDTSGAEDIRSHLQRASLGGVLTGEELRQVVATLQVARRVRAAVLRHRSQVGSLAHLAEGMPLLRDLEKDIERCIGAGGEVLGGASRELAHARSQARTAYQRLENALNRIIRSSLGQEVLQESLITERSFRLVLPVKAEMRGRLPGLVHDISQSGATMFVEPSQTVQLGNAWREWALEEERLVNQVLRQLSARVGEVSQEASEAVQRLVHMDLVLAKARYALALKAHTPVLWEGERPWVRLVRARHPLLKGEVVPISLVLGPETSTMLITGPNAGGKTVSLKAVGLLVLMHQAGLQVPLEEESVLPVFDAVYADIGDRQSLEESLSTFSSHVHNLLAILMSATPMSLVLLDELGTSTDPEEGAALAKGVLAHLTRQGVTTVATTHYRSVAAFVGEFQGMVNASFELHPETLQPTYHLSTGLPGRSFALVIASRLGMPPAIIEEARTMLDPGYMQAEGLLTELQEERFLAARIREEAETAKEETVRLRGELERQLAELNRQQGEMLAEARREVAARVEEVRKRLRQAEHTVEEAEASAKLREALSVALGVRRELRGKDWRLPQEEQPPWWHTLKPGDRVRIKGFDVQAEVVAPPGEDGKVEVRLGTVRARFELERLSPPETLALRETERLAPGIAPGIILTPSAALDLRGTRVEEALERVDPFLDRSLLQGLSQVRIIHGKGTGALRQAIREHLGRHSLVANLEPEMDAIGGDGATLVTLA